MNKKMKQLSEQAWDWTLENRSDADDVFTAFSNKLAELVIDECASWIHSKGVGVVSKATRIDLKNHFGLTE